MTIRNERAIEEIGTLGYMVKEEEGEAEEEYYANVTVLGAITHSVYWRVQQQHHANDTDDDVDVKLTTNSAHRSFAGQQEQKRV